MPKQSAVLLIFLTLLFPLSASEIKLPHIVTVVKSSSSLSKTELSEEDLEKFSSTEEALESVGISFKDSNNELTFHGLWNSSIKVYVNGILMNDPNTGKFDFSSLDISSVRSIKIDPVSSDGAVSVYVETLYPDYTRTSFSVGGYSKSYFSFKDISPNDSWRLNGTMNYPLVFKDGSSLILQENLSAGFDANHFGYESKKASYNPTLKDSYEKWENRYAGWEKRLVNNSFSAVFSSVGMPGSTFGFTNFISWNNQNCGRVGGYYYNYENQEDVNAVFAFPVFIPSKDYRLKITPAYRLSNLGYTKDSRYEKINDQYKIHSFSILEETTIKKIFTLNGESNFDFSNGNKLWNAFFDPGVNINLLGMDFSFSAPVNFFYTASQKIENAESQFDFLYSAEIKKTFSFEEEKKLSLFLNASRNITNPVFQQLYYDGTGGSGNPNLKTERAYSFYGGTSWNGKSEFSIKPFLIFYKDKIAWVPVNGTDWKPENSGSSTNYGFDLLFDSNSLFRNISFKGSYTFCKALLTTNEKVYGNQIQYTPVHALNLTFEVNLPKSVKASFAYNFTSEKFKENENINVIPAQHFIDGRIDWKIGNGDLYIFWKNILDFKYVSVDGYPDSGSSITLGAKYSF